MHAPDGITLLVVLDPDDVSQNQYGDPKRRAQKHTVDGPSSRTVARFRRFYKCLALFLGVRDADIVAGTTCRRRQNAARHIGILVQFAINVHREMRQSAIRERRRGWGKFHRPPGAAQRDRAQGRKSASPGREKSRLKCLRSVADAFQPRESGASAKTIPPAREKHPPTCNSDTTSCRYSSTMANWSAHVVLSALPFGRRKKRFSWLDVALENQRERVGRHLARLNFAFPRRDSEFEIREHDHTQASGAPLRTFGFAGRGIANQ